MPATGSRPHLTSLTTTTMAVIYMRRTPQSQSSNIWLPPWPRFPHQVNWIVVVVWLACERERDLNQWLTFIVCCHFFFFFLLLLYDVWLPKASFGETWESWAPSPCCYNSWRCHRHRRCHPKRVISTLISWPVRWKHSINSCEIVMTSFSFFHSFILSNLLHIQHTYTHTKDENQVIFFKEKGHDRVMAILQRPDDYSEEVLIEAASVISSLSASGE